MIGNLESLYNWFDMMRDEIISGHENERVLISDNKVLGYFADERAAVSEALKRGLEPGNFLVQRCITEDTEIKLLYNVNLAVGYGY
ncbi:MAG: hypothetical protein J5747_11860 [Spirochaetaceae bacterium]|nr:hypothetical protein [Spirochaetaceae bacterium]